MRVEQAIYTSLARDGRAGYHVVSRSPGVSAEDCRTLASWSPSHGALLTDHANLASVNFHPLTPGRYALSRSIAGRAEYSGRGGREVYTHALILDAGQLEQACGNPFAICRDALALGHLCYDVDPRPILEPVELGRCHPPADPDRLASQLGTPGPVDLADIRRQLARGESIQVAFPGDRQLLVECLLAQLPPTIARSLSFSTSLQASTARPYRLAVLH